jgi:hypothetical protein
MDDNFKDHKRIIKDPIEERIKEIKEIVGGDGTSRIKVCFPLVLILAKK